MTRSASELAPVVVFSRFGVPEEVVQVEERPVAVPGAGEVLVEVEGAPINPADLNVLEGKYGVLPPLPAVPGIEGVGRILEVGKATTAGGLLEGARVLLPHGFGSWRRYGVLGAEGLVVVPNTVPVEQAAMLRINPATAHGLLHQFRTLEAGEWVVQNAANSGVGRSVIQIAKARGWRTLNVVRREGLEEELRAMGADAVVVEGDGLSKRILEATGGVAPRLGLNAVGGESALGVAGSLGEDGALVTYGAMGRQPLRIPNGFLIFKNVSFHGFWVSRWYQRATPREVQAMFRELFEWASAGHLHTPVEGAYGLEHIQEALKHAQRERRSGKILLTPTKRGVALE